MTTPKLRFKEFEGNWNKVKLFQIGSFKNGINKDKNDFGYGVPFINLMDVFGKNSISKNNFDLVNATQKEIENYSLQQGDILFIRSSVKPEGVAETAVILEDLPNTVYSGFLIRYRMNKQVNLFYKKYCFSTENFRKQVLSLSTTSANTNINQESLNLLDLALPNLEEQTKIASFLSGVDEKISQLNRKHELLSQYKQGMMQKLFSQQIRFKANDGSEFGEWEEIKLVDFLAFNPRPINKPEDSYHALGVRSHFKGLFNKFNSEPEKISMDTLYRVKENDVVVNITFAWEGAMAVAESEHDEGLVSHRFPTYLCDTNKVNLNFFKYRFTQKDFLSHLQLCSPGGAGRNRVLNKKAFLEISFYKPCLEEQTKIANFLSAIDQKIEVVAQQIEQAKQWKKGLLQQMFV
ncbi:restriction endonuclease subunit S [Acinetobacter baumannii]|nr:restriction endonuclease subunit S [Acinetobacter baumannii]RSF45154.1 restriction endonuclease subunit S [Acinetobacter baumannii]RSF57161.1 restriction endonuclease subunit S [Acinetobacter baumannii]